MALRVGMRVKKVRGIMNLGLTAVVVSCSNADSLIDVKIDRVAQGEFGTYPAGFVATTDPVNWEPIIPEGHKPVEWSQCLWQPEHIREGVST